MIRIRRGVVVDVRARRAGLLDVTVDVDGERANAIAYEGMVAPPAPGDTVVLNTTAVALGLGTGGAHFVVAVEGKEAGDVPPGHAMKLRYTPAQTAVEVVEESHREVLDALDTLGGAPVVSAGLHSALAPAVLGARAIAPGCRVAFVMTDGGALPLGLSDTVAALRDHGLLATTITAGQAVGGDLEAVSVPGALAAAVAVARADVIVVAMGPGNLGTASRWGFALIEVAAIVNAAAAMGGRPIVAPRLSFADPRERHRGVSHHTLTALSLALAPAEIALPSLAPERDAAVRDALKASGLLDRHALVDVDLGAAEDALRASPVPLGSMGRGYDDDPDAFRAAAAAGVLAARAR